MKLPLLLACCLISACSSVRTITFHAPDGATVEADVYGTSRHTLILAHGGRFTKESWSEQAPVLADAGFQVIAINFRGRGNSVAPDDPQGNNVHLDVVAAIDHALTNDAKPISIIGASFGGWASSKAIALRPNTVDRVVFLACPVEEPETLTGRKLFILARDDFRGEDTLRLPEIQEDFDLAPEPKQLVLLEGDAHAQFLFESDQADRLMDELLRFLTED
ncbi:MAG: alpha/beta hydrolase [Phycisphaerales bacterium JB043]